MKCTVMLCLIGLKAAHAVAPFELVVEEWETWKMQHEKIFSRNYRDASKNSGLFGGNYVQEEKFRMKIWMENKAKAEKHNRHAFKVAHSYHLAMNEWGDLLHHEFAASVNGYKARASNSSTIKKPIGAKLLMPAHNETLTETVDWREHGAVTPVKNKGQCGSCWSFSNTGALESMHHIANGKLVSLSEQNLMDCSTKYGNQGCKGGLMDAAFQYIKDMSYSYEGKDDTCRYNPVYRGAIDIGFMDLEAGNEAALKTALAIDGLYHFRN